MKRWMWIGMLAAGCAPQDVGFELLSFLPGEVDGVSLDGSRARVGMEGQVCDVDVATGAIEGDQEPTAGREHVLHAVGDQVLGIADGQLFLAGVEVSQWPGTALEGRLTAKGAVGLLREGEAGCRVVFDGQGFDLDGLDCSGAIGFAVDPEGDTAWVADGTTVARVDRGGESAAWSVPADRVALSGERLVMGERGSSRLVAMDLEGHPLWNIELDGSLVELQPMGQLGLTAAMVDDGTGGTLLVVGADGEQRGVHRLPAVADVTVADDGSTVALVTPDGTLFYAVEDDRSAWSVGKDLQAAGPDALLVGATVGATAVVSVVGVAVLVATLAD